MQFWMMSIMSGKEPTIFRGLDLTPFSDIPEKMGKMAPSDNQLV
jgi:hypothetical protein